MIALVYISKKGTLSLYIVRVTVLFITPWKSYLTMYDMSNEKANSINIFPITDLHIHLDFYDVHKLG